MKGIRSVHVHQEDIEDLDFYLDENYGVDSCQVFSICNDFKHVGHYRIFYWIEDDIDIAEESDTPDPIEILYGSTEEMRKDNTNRYPPDGDPVFQYDEDEDGWVEGYEDLESEEEEIPVKKKKK